MTTCHVGSDYYASLRGAFRAVGKLQSDVKVYMEEMGMDEPDHDALADAATPGEEESSPPPTLKAPPIKQPLEPENPTPMKTRRRETTDESAGISEGQLQQIVDSTVAQQLPPPVAKYAFKKEEYHCLHKQISQKKRELKALRKQHDDMLFGFVGLPNPFTESDWEWKTLCFLMSNISFKFGQNLAKYSEMP